MTSSHDGFSAKLPRFFRLVDACAAPGCPVCRALIADSRHYLEALLYEQVNDPDTRRRLRAAWGLCNQHTWMLGEVSDSAFGSAIIHEDMLRVVGRQFERRRAFESSSLWRRLWHLGSRTQRPLIVDLRDRRPMCPACQERIVSEREYVQVALRFVDDRDLQCAYARSDGYCVPHVLQAVEMGSPARADALIALALPKWAAVRQDLGEFIEKHDHRNTRPFTDTDRAISGRALEALAGARGGFDSDAHGTTRAATARSVRVVAELRAEVARLRAELGRAKSGRSD
jgi:hypothetical protein